MKHRKLFTTGESRACPQRHSFFTQYANLRLTCRGRHHAISQFRTLALCITARLRALIQYSKGNRTLLVTGNHLLMAWRNHAPACVSIPQYDLNDRTTCIVPTHACTLAPMSIPVLTPPPESEVIKSWSRDSPRVSVLVPVFNHSDWISDCLSGILSQQTDFPFEIVVRDDASTDGTQQILTEFSRNYPKIIKLLLNESNRFPDESPIPALVSHAASDIFAICEGDDLWVTPKKLSRQVALIHSQPNISCVSHAIAVLRETGELARLGRRERTIFKRGDMKCIASMPTLSLLFRRPLILPDKEMAKAPFSDVVLKAILGSEGRVIYEGNMLGAVYRVHQRGLFSSNSPAEATAKTTFSQLIAAQALCNQGRYSEAEQLLAIATRGFTGYFDLAHSISSIRAVHQATGLRFQAVTRLRETFGDVPLIRRMYFYSRGKNDPKLPVDIQEVLSESQMGFDA